MNEQTTWSPGTTRVTPSPTSSTIARSLVAEDERELHRDVSGHDMQIGVAEAGVGEADQHLTVARAVEVQFLDLDASADLVQHRRLGLHRSSFPHGRPHGQCRSGGPAGPGRHRLAATLPGMTASAWTSGDAYEAFMGRWSRGVAARFVAWLRPDPDARWLDVGCGTGALSATVLASAQPRSIVGIDPSDAFVEAAAMRCADPRAQFRVGKAGELPVADGAVDVVVSGLVLNFVPAPAQALQEFSRVTAPGGTVAAYVWDYAEGMAMLRHFWDAAVDLDPGCRRARRRHSIPVVPPRCAARAVDRRRPGRDHHRCDHGRDDFADFDDYWSPFLGGQGPAAAYVKSLTESQQAALRDRLRREVDPGGDGPISLTARAWAVRGTRP